MRILIDGRLYGLENAGLGRYLVNLVFNLKEIDRKNEYIILLRTKYFYNLDLPSNWKKVLADLRHYGFLEQIKLPGIIRREKPDIVHFPHFNIPIFFKGRFLVTIHDMLMHDFAGLSATTLPTPLYSFKYLIYKFVFKKAVLDSAKVLVPSKFVKNEIIKNYRVDSEKIIVLYEGFDEKIGVKGVKIKNRYFFYAGNAYPHKNLTRLIEAIVLLNKNLEEKILLVIAGARNVFVKRLTDEVEKYKAKDYVKIMGYVQDENLGGLYRNSIAFVFPSLSEGFGLPGLEALSFGTLLLASDIPIFQEIYGQSARYFNPLDPVSIKEAMLEAIEMHNGDRRKKVEFGKKFVKKYSWSKMAKETLGIYEKFKGNKIDSGRNDGKN